MKIAVTGHKGFIGSELVKNGCIPITSDITDYPKLREELATISPDVLIHAAAKTDVDWCEANEKEAFRVNVRGTSNVDFACRYAGVKLLYLSTFHVFSGHSIKPYKEKSICRPKNVYGFTKWAGELICTADNKNAKIVRLGSVWSKESIKPTVERLLSGDVISFPTFIKRSYISLWYVIKGLRLMAQNWDRVPNIINLVSKNEDMSHYEFWLNQSRSANALPRDKEIDDKAFRSRNGCLDGSLFYNIFGDL